MGFSTLEAAIEYGSSVRNGKNQQVIESNGQFFVMHKHDKLPKKCKIVHKFLAEKVAVITHGGTRSRNGSEKDVSRYDGEAGRDIRDVKSKPREQTYVKRLDEEGHNLYPTKAMSEESKLLLWMKREEGEATKKFRKQNLQQDKSKMPAVLPESIKQPVGDMKFTLVRNDTAVKRGRKYVTVQKSRPKGMQSGKQKRVANKSGKTGSTGVSIHDLIGVNANYLTETKKERSVRVVKEGTTAFLGLVDLENQSVLDKEFDKEARRNAGIDKKKAQREEARARRRAKKQRG